MKKTKRLWALLLAMVMALGLITTAFAAPTIDSGRKASLSLYKYDITAASADGAWDAASYVSTGVQDDAVTDKLAQYAIQGVEFSYLRVASISTYSQRESGQYKVGVLYGFADDAVLVHGGAASVAAGGAQGCGGSLEHTVRLQRQFASGGDDQSLHLVVGCVGQLDEGQQIGEGLARAGGREDDDIALSSCDGFGRGLLHIVELRNLQSFQTVVHGYI